MFSMSADALRKRITLPADWKEAARAVRADGVVVPLVRAMQSVIERLGDKSITVEHVLELARHATGSLEYPLFGRYEPLFRELTSAAGDG